MKTCYNCENPIQDKDKFCRNCGCPIESNSHYIFINVLIAFATIVILGLIALFIASYIIMK